MVPYFKDEDLEIVRTFPDQSDLVLGGFPIPSDDAVDAAAIYDFSVSRGATLHLACGPITEQRAGVAAGVSAIKVI